MKSGVRIRFGEADRLLYSIQFLRFAAAFVVIVSHSFNVLAIPKTIIVGDAGVDVFFVISGIVISLSTKDVDTVATFVKRRLIRIFPLYWIALGAWTAFVFTQWGALPTTTILWHSITLISVDQDFYLFPAWTLSFELLFYAAFACAMGIYRPARIWLSAAALMFIVAADSSRLLTFPASENVPLCVEFVGGLFVAEIVKQRRATDHRIGVALCLAAIALFIINANGTAVRPLGWGVAALFLAFGVIQFEGIAFFRRSWVQVLGNASYAMYLFHIPAMTWLREFSAMTIGFDLRIHPHVGLPSLVISALLISTVAHLVVERPMMRILRRLFLRAPEHAAESSAISAVRIEKATLKSSGS